MKIYRRIFGKISNKEMKSILENILKEDLGLSYFSKDLDEASEEYIAVLKYVKIYNLDYSIIGTKFTDEEISKSEILCFNGAAPFSYPEPQEPKFLEDTFEDVCNQCGTYQKQKSDFSIKKDPKLNPHKIFSLHWVGDKLFCTNELYDLFFKKMGFEKRTVQLYGKNTKAKNVVQLVFPSAPFNLDMGSLEHSICKRCGKIRYLPTTIGFFPMPKSKDFSIIETNEFFGSGHYATHRLLITKDIMNQMIENKIAKKHQFIPCR